VSLLSCFLGLGVGFALIKNKKPLAFLIAPLFTLQVLFLEVASLTPLQQVLQNPIFERFAMGLGQSASKSQNMLIYAFLVMVFIFNALCFVPIGQLISSLMAKEKKLIAYHWNLLGSILGILLFTLLSYFWAPPLVWIVVGFFMLAVLVRKHSGASIYLVVSLGIMALFLTLPKSLVGTTTYSPYQVISAVKDSDQIIKITANKTYFQQMKTYEAGSSEFRHYDIPYLVNPDPSRVLVVGSGAGNDVAAGLRNGARAIDAVEIDPVIYKLGKQLHPEKPYNDSRVQVMINDARNYIRTTDQKYDIISYGLLDSHTLLSGKSSVRLDSYVYTVEAFREARRLLKPNGVISLSFATGNPEIVKKIYLMLQKAFDGKGPGVYALSRLNTNFLIGDSLDISALNFPETISDVTNSVSENKVKTDVATDDWPFLYMPTRKYPYSLVFIVALLLISSIFFIRKLLPHSSTRVSLAPFFLGAGFMLIEAKGITELALFYGSTWVVTAITITAILMMAALANLYVMKKGVGNKKIVYFLLLLAIVLSYLLISGAINLGPTVASKLIITAFLTIPIFFSGIAFSMELRRSKSMAIVLSSNLLGAMLGGFLEYNSMYFGFGFLYLLALIIYFLAFIFAKNPARR
jgi:spermidine synthase